ncbi:Uncharacterized protein PCOAH_00019830 [Plasmodium coatneyi]|uniref:GRIP domain-containing protein n=1 Tax=Plasmodium coatneyi TaxID=208452 RepID=A0A1B1DY61_9APIC|nr:Uncharacterized protein PCOAH_00019830 [Plasmodium coatneyi]ANQ07680.1 Uncharacterized protein PCOAH_00019830 [Plasmodium coatneyi]
MNIFEENEAHEMGFQADGGFQPDGDLLVDNPNDEQGAFFPNSVNSYNAKNEAQLRDSDLFLTLNNNFAPSNNSTSQEPILKEGEVEARPCKYPDPTSQDVLHCYKAKDHPDEKNYLYSLHNKNEAPSIEMTYDGFLNDNNYCKSRSMSMNFTDPSDDCGGSSDPPGGTSNDKADSGEGNNSHDQRDNQEGEAKVDVDDETNNNGKANEHVEVNESDKIPCDGDNGKDDRPNDNNGDGNPGGSDSNDDGDEDDDEEGEGNDSKEAKEGSEGEGKKEGSDKEEEKVDVHNCATNDGGEINGHDDNPQEENEEGEKNGHKEEGIDVGVDGEKANPVIEVVPIEEVTPVVQVIPVEDLQSEVTKLKEDIKNMKKEKIHLLAKFKAYTLNNKREIERLEGECKGREDEVKTLDEECKKKDSQIEQLMDQLAQLKDQLAHLQEEKAKMEREANTHAEEVKRLQEENDCLNEQIEEEHAKLEKLQSSLDQQDAEGNKLKLDLQDKDVLFLFSTGSDRLVCFTKNGEHHIVDEELFRQSYPTVKVPTCVQDEHLNELKEQSLQVEKIAEEKNLVEEEKNRVEEEFLAYKNKVTALINETNESWKNIEEKNDTIQRLNNSLLKYEQDIESYKNEVSTMTEKYKVLEGQLCREKNIREQQNVVLADFKKQMQKEKAEIRRKCKEQYDEECQQKVNEVKAIFSEKEALLQNKIQLLLHQVDRMVFSSEEKSKEQRVQSQTQTEQSEELTPLGQLLPPRDDSTNDLSCSTTGEKWRSGGVQEKRDSQEPTRSEIDCESNVDSVLLTKNNKRESFPHPDAANHCEDKNDDTTKIPIYPNEYKKIRKKLDKYELVISKEKKDKKDLLEHINVLTSQIKIYESISGNCEHVLYQKNILQNFIAQIPSNIKIDDYVSVIYNTFNFSAQEIELINAKRAKR